MSVSRSIARGLGARPAGRPAGAGPQAAGPDPFPSWFPVPDDEAILATGIGAAGGMSRAVGVPALLSVVLRTGQGIGMLPVKVYRRDADGNREEAPDTQAWARLHDLPSSEATSPEFNADVGSSIAGLGKAVVRKIKSNTGRGVLELIVEDANAWKARRSGGRLVFDKVSDGGQTPPLDRRDLIYMRGLALNGSLEPLSPIGAHRQALTSVGLLRQTFERSHYRNGARPWTVLTGPEDMEREELGEWVDAWNETAQGADQAGGTAAIAGGFKVESLPINFSDAQFVEANQWTAAQVGAVYGMPRPFLNLSDVAPTEADWRYWVTFGLGWIAGVRDAAFSADPDLFPREADGAYAETVTDALLKPDTVKRFEAYKAARHAGWLTSNEVRRLENYPPHPDGDVLQAIPVGGGESQAQKTQALDRIDELVAAAEHAEQAGTLADVIASAFERLEARVEDRLEASDRSSDLLSGVISAIQARHATADERSFELVLGPEAAAALRPDPSPAAVTVPVQVDVHVPAQASGRRTITLSDGRTATVEDDPAPEGT